MMYHWKIYSKVLKEHGKGSRKKKNLVVRPLGVGGEGVKGLATKKEKKTFLKL